MREMDSVHQTVIAELVEEVRVALDQTEFRNGNSPMNKCKVCGGDIKITIYRGLGYCCENHRKILMEEK